MKFPMRRPVLDRRGWSTRPKPLIGRRAFGALLCVVLAGGAFVSAPPKPASADALSDAYAKQTALQKLISQEKAQVAALNASQAALSGEIASTKADLASTVSNINAVKAQIVDMTVKVAKAQGSVDSLETTVAQLDQQLADVQAEEQVKQAELEARKQILADRIRTAYDTDRTSMLETVLSSDDFTDIVSEVGYEMDFAGQDKVLAQEIVEEQQVLSVMHRTVIDTLAQSVELHALAAKQKTVLDGQMTELAAAKDELAKLEAQQKKLLAAEKARYAALARNKAKLKATLVSQAKSERAIEALIRKLILAALQSGGIPSQYSGSLQWPMPGVVTQPFGCTGFYLEPAYGDCAHFHKGIDIANTSGTPIHAAGPGKIVFAGKSPYDPAYIVVIAHSSNLLSWYGHVQTRIPVHVGQYVLAGQVIAYEGCTGWCTGPHLHWAIQLNDAWVNPRLFL